MNEPRANSVAITNGLIFNGESESLSEDCIRVADGQIVELGGRRGADLGLAPVAQEPSVLWAGPKRRAVFQGGMRVARAAACLSLD
jgi:hypothetical protein